MIALNTFTITKLSEDKNLGVFEISPLPQGYGNTLGNILRRILLSSVPGAAVTAVKLNGVQHEYTSMVGLSDDVLTLMLSFKNVVVSYTGDEPVELSLKVKGKKNQAVEVTVADIEKNSAVQLINQDYVITKLTTDIEFDAVLTIESGVGYKLPDEEKRKEISTMPIDANFSPVKLVKYEVLPTRVGQQTDLDLIRFEVTTNGSITPQESLSIASTILSEMSNQFLIQSNNITGLSAKVESFATKLSEGSDIVQSVSKKSQSFPIKDLDLSTRLSNALLRAGYEDLSQMEGMAEEEIVNIRGLGAKSVDELINTLKELDIKFI